MKKINILLAAIVLLLGVSCGRKLEFEHETFITLDKASLSVSESAGIVSIPVSIYNPTGERIQVAVEAVDGEGEEGALAGENYEIVSPAAGVLTFEGETTSADIEVRVKPVEGLTGTKNFSIRISSLTRGINVGGYDVASVKILDDDHPLAVFIGKWNATLIEGTTSMSYETEINIEAVEGNYSRLKIDSGLDPVYGKGLEVRFLATADDLKQPGRIEVASKQLTGYENFFISGLERDEQGYIKFTDSFTISLNSDGSLSIDGMYGIIVPNEAAGGYALAAAYTAGSQLVKK